MRTHSGLPIWLLFGLLFLGLGLIAVRWMAAEPTPADTQARLQAFRLPPGVAQRAADILRDTLREGKDVRITVDEKRDILVVFASPKDLATVDAVLKRLEKSDQKEMTPNVPELKPDDLSDPELRKLVVSLSKQVDELQQRVQKLEEEHRLRIILVGPK